MDAPVTPVAPALGAIRVPISVPCTCRKYFSLDAKEFIVGINQMRWQRSAVEGTKKSRKFKNSLQAVMPSLWGMLVHVYNLLGVTLNRTELELLSKGLSFCPTPHCLNSEAVWDHLERYFRRLCLREFFLDDEEDEEISNTDISTQFRPPSSWMPPKGRNAALEIYIQQVRTDVEHQLDNINKKHCHDNLLSHQRKALRELWQRSDIIIKPADKGSVVVVLSKDDYIKEAERQLSNHAHYQKLNSNSTLRYASVIKKYVESMFSRRQIHVKTKNFLIPQHPRTAEFYLLPKIHKPGNPGRPIVSSNGAPTENVVLCRLFPATLHLRPSILC